MTKTVLVHVYEGPEKGALIEVVPIIDGGMVTDDGIQPTSDEGLIHLVKFQLRAQKRASDSEIEQFFYEIDRKN